MMSEFETQNETLDLFKDLSPDDFKFGAKVLQLKETMGKLDPSSNKLDLAPATSSCRPWPVPGDAILRGLKSAFLLGVCLELRSAFLPGGDLGVDLRYCY